MRLVLFLLLTLASVLAGCSSPAPAGPDVRIAGNAYAPATVTADPGTEVTVANDDATTHTLTGAGFDTRDVPAGATRAFTAPATPGEYPFTCAYHPSMKGTLTVA